MRTVRPATMGIAVIPHCAAGRLEAWRPIVEDGHPLAWIGIDEQTLVIGRPGETWSVAGRGRVHVVPVGAICGVSRKSH